MADSIDTHLRLKWVLIKFTKPNLSLKYALLFRIINIQQDNSYYNPPAPRDLEIK